MISFFLILFQLFSYKKMLQESYQRVNKTANLLKQAYVSVEIERKHSKLR